MGGLLRLCTAGSVDDGKSTLIGRLLYDARAVYEDQVHSVSVASAHRGLGPIDFSLFTDGLKAEREQGITIDVAYRYFATARRKFILADTPGHEQFTRNMATGASTADVAILLVDARHGLRPQSERHARIARLLGITDFVLAVNKMDLVDFSQARFDEIVTSFAPLLAGARVHAVPLSALHGDNVTAASPRTPWYEGPGLLAHLEGLPSTRSAGEVTFRFPIQLVLRPFDGFRGYAGRIQAGVVNVGDVVQAWPSGQSTRIARIVSRSGDLPTASAGQSVTLTLTDELDLTRGDTLAIGTPHVSQRFVADVVWMDERPLAPLRRYRLKHTTRIVGATVDTPLILNEIGRLTVTTTSPLIFDPYTASRGTGSFILIDPESSFTAGAGMIAESLADPSTPIAGITPAEQLLALVKAAATDEDALAALQSALAERQQG